MKNFFSEKPWYFALVAFSNIASPIFEWVVMYFFNEEAAKKILEKSVTISQMLPWIVGLIILVVCTIVYIVQLHKTKNSLVSSDELTSLNGILSKAVEENEYIESMQAFQYRISNSQKEKFIKLCYLAGAANERIEINTILQTYFYFSYPTYKKISKVSGYYDTYVKEVEPGKKSDFWTTFLKEGNDLCTDILNELNSIESVSAITERHCDMYRVLCKVLPAMYKNAIESFLDNKEVENALIKQKKTGILGAIVIQDLYIFRNQTSVSKSDRIYFAFPYNTKKNILFLGSINGSCFPSNDIETYCKDIVTKICSN